MTTVRAYREKIAAAAGKLSGRRRILGRRGAGNAAELRPLWDAGVFGFKCFLVPSGVEEFAKVGEDDLRAALPELEAIDAPLLAHAELPGRSKGGAKRFAERFTTRAATTMARIRARAKAENEAMDAFLASRRRIQLAHSHSASFPSNAFPQLQQAKLQDCR